MSSRYPMNRTGRELTARAKIWVKPTDQMDLWLDTQGYYRKHIGRDGTSLFRAVSEQTRFEVLYPLLQCCISLTHSVICNTEEGDTTPRNASEIRKNQTADIKMYTRTIRHNLARKWTKTDSPRHLCKCHERQITCYVFLTQAFHGDVRTQCLDYIQRHSRKFKNDVNCQLEEYIERMRNPLECGGKVEIEAMSLLYKYDFVLYQEVGKPAQVSTNYGFQNKILLCFSQEHHYDSVYTKQHISDAAFCQSIIYEILYKCVFELQEVDYAVKKMLHDKTSRYQRESSCLANGLAVRLEMRDSYVNVKDLLSVGVTPFPYKVAKSLDPDIYRNVEYDVWNDCKRGLRYGVYVWNNRELQVGVKCLVKLESKVCYAYIQEMKPNKGPVLVFVEELGEKLTVPYESLELLPQPPTPQLVPVPLKHLRQLPSNMKGSSSSTSAVQNPLENLECQDEDDRKLLLMWESLEKGDEVEDFSGRRTPKLKMFTESTKNKNSSKCAHLKSKEEISLETGSCSGGVSSDSVQQCPTPVTSTIVDCGYQQKEPVEYQQENFENFCNQSYVSQSCESTSEQDTMGNTKPQEHMQGLVPPQVLCLDTSHITSSYLNNTQPHQNNNNYQSPQYYTTNLLAQKSQLLDGSDLPLSDIATLRFFYNYGVDQYVRQNSTVRPVPPCYLNTSLSYVPEHVCTPASSSPYESCSVVATPDSSVAVSSPASIYCQHDLVTSSLSGVSVSSESDISHSSHQVAPRFKNRMKNNAQRQGVSYEGTPLIQQAEVSSTSSVLSPVSMPQPQGHLLPSPVNTYPSLPPTSTLPPLPPPPPPPPTLPPPPPLPPQPHPSIYYHPVDYETYCPPGYSDYNLYDHTPTAFYPVYSQSTAYSATAYIPQDAMIYQPVIPVPQIPASL